MQRDAKCRFSKYIHTSLTSSLDQRDFFADFTRESPVIINLIPSWTDICHLTLSTGAVGGFAHRYGGPKDVPVWRASRRRASGPGRPRSRAVPSGAVSVPGLCPEPMTSLQLRATPCSPQSIRPAHPSLPPRMFTYWRAASLLLENVNPSSLACLLLLLLLLPDVHKQRPLAPPSSQACCLLRLSDVHKQ